MVKSDIVSVTFDGSKYALHQEVVKNWVAKANFTDTTQVDGWSYLEVETNPSYPDTIQSYAAGYAEGASSSEIIYLSYRNTAEGFCKWKGKEFCDRLNAFLLKNNHWMKSMLAIKNRTCPVWHNIELILNQLQGVNDGYNVTGKEPMEEGAVLLMNLMGDIEDLSSVFEPDQHESNIKDWITGRLTGDGHCSALIKVLPGNADLYVSHVTWNTYQSMLRTQKKYIFPFRRTGSSPASEVIPGHTVSFSSYPGILHSGDDFYVLSSGLVTLETTIGNSNPALWVNVTAEGEILEWMRVIVSNRIATDGKTWSDYFSMHNSGTYNNQWMIVDYKQFKPFHHIKRNTLWILEQLPGKIVFGDQSHHLRKHTYWPSYNVPFYPEIFNLSGIPALVKRFGDWFSYDQTPRALIFKRDHKSVKGIPSMMRLMRYNDYQHDPLSHCNCTPPFSAENAISARNDLNPANGSYPFGALGHRSHGATDVKMTTHKMAKHFHFLAVNGPTYDQQPVFVWSKQDFANDTPHYGHPDAWKFKHVKHKWMW